MTRSIESDAASVPGAIYSSWPLVGGSNLHAKHLGHEMPTETASARRIDGVLAADPDRRVQFVKLDVDGFRETRPVFVMELAPYVLDERGTSLKELLALFIPHGYAFFTEQDERPLPSIAGEVLRLIGDGASMNVIARVP